MRDVASWLNSFSNMTPGVASTLCTFGDRDGDVLHGTTGRVRLSPFEAGCLRKTHLTETPKGPDKQGVSGGASRVRAVGRGL